MVIVTFVTFPLIILAALVGELFLGLEANIGYGFMLAAVASFLIHRNRKWRRGFLPGVVKLYNRITDDADEEFRRQHELAEAEGGAEQW